MTETQIPTFLFEALTTGDPQAMALLLDRYGQMLAAMAASFGWRDSDRTEFVHDVLLKVFDNGHRLDEPGAITTWVMRIAKNLAIDRVRGERRFRGLAEDEAEQRDDRLHSRPTTPDDAAIARELLERVRGVLSAVPPVWKEALEDHLNDLSREETAKHLRVSPRSVKRYLASLRRRFRELRGKEVG